MVNLKQLDDKDLITDAKQFKVQQDIMKEQIGSKFLVLDETASSVTMLTPCDSKTLTTRNNPTVSHLLQQKVDHNLFKKIGSL